MFLSIENKPPFCGTVGRCINAVDRRNIKNMYTGVSLKDQGQVEVKQRSTNELYHIITRHELRKMKVEVKMFEDYTVVIKKS